MGSLDNLNLTKASYFTQQLTTLKQQLPSILDDFSNISEVPISNSYTNKLCIYLYREVERSTGLPLIRFKGLTTLHSLDVWEEALDDLPECWVFVSGECVVNDKKGWRTDSLVSMYAFRWSPGKWLGRCPSQAIL